jgi:photosystem II stability/assembly factor-like uncharacterized protein
MTSNGYIYLSSDQGRSWQIINAQNSPLSSVATNSNTIFAIGSYQTLSSSTDLGRTWNTRYIQIQGYPQLTGLWAFANKLYLGTASGFYASFDGGNSWSQSLLSDQVVEDIEQSSQALYVGTNNGVFSSTDEGATFGFSPLGYVSAIHTYNSRVFVGIASGDIYSSTDLGKTWTRQGSTGGGILFSFLLKDSLLIAGTQYEGVTLSDDLGQSWTNTNMRSEYVYSLFDHGDALFAGTRYDGMSMSLDGGKSWQGTSVASMNIGAIAAFDSVLLASQVYSSNIYRSSDAGRTWTTNRLPADFVFYFATSGSTYFAGANHGVFVSTDKGLTWNIRGSQLYNDNVMSVAFSNGYLFAGIGGGGLRKSSDLGATWTYCQGIPNNDEVYDLLRVGSRIYAATLTGVYGSSNQGVDWIKHTPDGYGHALSAVDSVVFVSGYFSNYSVMRSTDNGQSWIEMLKTLTTSSSYFYGMASHGHDLYLGTDNGVFRTSDLGTTWITFSDSLQHGGEVVTSLATDGTNLYAGSNHDGIWWRPFQAPYLAFSHEPIILSNVLIGGVATADVILRNTGSLSLSIQSVTVADQQFKVQLNSPSIPPGYSSSLSIRFNPSKLGEQTAHLIFHSNAFNAVDSVNIYGLTRQANGLETQLGSPNVFHLENNYPNPFNSTTTILFGVPAPDHVRLQIFGIAGSIIASLLDETIPAGNYEYHWNATGNASGVYFLRLQTTTTSAIRKLLYLK